MPTLSEISDAFKLLTYDWWYGSGRPDWDILLTKTLLKTH